MTVHSRRQSKSRMSAANASVIAWAFLWGSCILPKFLFGGKVTCFIHLLDQMILSEYDFTSGQVTHAYASHLPSGEEPVFWEKTAFTLLFLLMSLFTDKLEWIFLCIFWETGAESLRFSADTCLAPWWIPLPLLRLGWPFFILLISSSLSCAAVWSWGKRWGLRPFCLVFLPRSGLRCYDRPHGSPCQHADVQSPPKLRTQSLMPGGEPAHKQGFLLAPSMLLGPESVSPL